MVIMESALIASTAWLAYVTQLPYAARKRLHSKIRFHVVRVIILVRHHGKWAMWQIVALVPGRLRERD